MAPDTLQYLYKAVNGQKLHQQQKIWMGKRYNGKYGMDSSWVSFEIIHILQKKHNGLQKMKISEEDGKCTVCKEFEDHLYDVSPESQTDSSGPVH